MQFEIQPKSNDQPHESRVQQRAGFEQLTARYKHMDLHSFQSGGWQRPSVSVRMRRQPQRRAHISRAGCASSESQIPWSRSGPVGRKEVAVAQSPTARIRRSAVRRKRSGVPPNREPARSPREWRWRFTQIPHTGEEPAAGSHREESESVEDTPAARSKIGTRGPIAAAIQMVAPSFTLGTRVLNRTSGVLLSRRGLGAGHERAGRSRALVPYRSAGCGPVRNFSGSDWRLVLAHRRARFRSLVLHLPRFPHAGFARRCGHRAGHAEALGMVGPRRDAYCILRSRRA